MKFLSNSVRLCSLLPLFFQVHIESPIETLRSPNAKRIALVSDTHWGGVESRMDSKDELKDWEASMEEIEADYLFHLGDITDDGNDPDFQTATETFEALFPSSSERKVWCVPGGNHDGLFDLGETRWKMGYYHILRQLSQWYTLKIGNNVFVFLGYFAQPAEWSSGNYGGYERADLMNQNKLDWFEKTLQKWNGTGNNIFVLHHFPLHHTNIYTHSWANMSRDRFVYECEQIKPILAKYPDALVWFSGHVHVDSDAIFDDGPGTSSGTVLPAGVRPDLPPNVHFISVGDIWREHGPGWGLGLSTVANFRILQLQEGQDRAYLQARDATNQMPARMSRCRQDEQGSDLVWDYEIPLSYPACGLNDPPEYEQAWDVWEYSDESNYSWCRDDQGLQRDRDGWIESRWDFWGEADFSRSWLFVDSSNPEALTHRIYFSNDGMQSWSEEFFTPEQIQQMPPARWVKVVSEIRTVEPVYIRDIRFEGFRLKKTPSQSKLRGETVRF